MFLMCGIDIEMFDNQNSSRHLTANTQVAAWFKGRLNSHENDFAVAVVIRFQ